MLSQTPIQHIEATPGIAGGRPRIAGHRITVRYTVGHIHYDFTMW